MRISDWSSDVCSSDLGPDLTHTLKGRLLGGNDGIDLPHAEIGQKVGLVDRTLGVPDIGKLGSCIRDGSRWRAFSDQFAQSFGRLLSGGGQVAFQFFARLSEGDAIALPLGWRAVRKHGNPGGTDARLGREVALDCRCGTNRGHAAMIPR